MKLRTVEKCVNQLVRLTFKRDWFNEATQEWIHTDEEYGGRLRPCAILDRPKRKFFYLEDAHAFLGQSNEPKLRNSCFSANSISSIKVLNGKTYRSK